MKATQSAVKFTRDTRINQTSDKSDPLINLTTDCATLISKRLKKWLKKFYEISKRTIPVEIFSYINESLYRVQGPNTKAFSW